MELGFSLSTEEAPPRELVRLAAMAEDQGFPFAVMSDHYHPWTSKHGHSPFAYAVLGAVAQATSRLRVGTAVTCPIMRYHPALVAQMSATVADLFDGRFFLGLGAGENLNEHIYGDQWPQPAIRHEMLQEAITIIRTLWTGEKVTYVGNYFTVDEARLFTLPAQQPPIYVAASGPQAAEIAADNDGLIDTKPDKNVVSAFENAGGRGKPRYAELTVCYDEDEARARKIAHEWWPQTALSGNVNWEIKSYEHFDQLVKGVTEEMVAEVIPCGPDVGKIREELQKFIDAGFSHVYLHQVGPEKEKFLQFAARELLPEFSRERQPAGVGTSDRELGGRGD